MPAQRVGHAESQPRELVNRVGQESRPREPVGWPADRASQDTASREVAREPAESQPREPATASHHPVTSEGSFNAAGQGGVETVKGASSSKHVPSTREGSFNAAGPCGAETVKGYDSLPTLSTVVRAAVRHASRASTLRVCPRLRRPPVPECVVHTPGSRQALARPR